MEPVSKKRKLSDYPEINPPDEADSNSESEIEFMPCDQKINPPDEGNSDSESEIEFMPCVEKMDPGGEASSDDSDIEFMDCDEEPNTKEISFMATVEDLPHEVLSRIFALLPIEDRKNTRVVCKRWNSLNNDRDVSKKEKVLFVASLMDGNFEMIEKGERDVLNLEFFHVNFNDQSTRLYEFWRNVGPKIESLTLRHCLLSENTIGHIIEFCDKLQYIAIENPKAKWWPCQRGGRLMSAPVLEELIKKNIRRNQLRTLKLETFNDGWLSNKVLQVLFDTYPSMENFEFRCEHFIEIEEFTTNNIPEEFLESSEISTFTNVLRKIVESRNYLKRIHLESVTCKQNNFLHTDLMGHNFPGLTSIGNIRVEPKPEHPIFGFLSGHNHLTTVQFTVININRTVEHKSFLTRLMNNLLDFCTQLESLKMEVRAYVCLSDKTIFSKIQSSKLKTLYLNFKLKVRCADANPKKIINKHLKYLHLSVFGNKLSAEMTHAFIKTCHGLSELVIDGSGLNDLVLQDIFRYQRQLTSLKLRRLEYGADRRIAITNYGFTGIESNGERSGYSIKNLQNLKCLEISRESSNITRTFVEELEFPNLTSLYLTTSRPHPEELNGEELKRFFWGLPNLEAIVFVGDFCIHTWLSIVERMKKLKFIYIKSYFTGTNHRKFRDALYEQFFKNCPSLRALHRCKVNICERPDKWKICSYYEDAEKNIKKFDSTDRRSFPPELIDPCWMQF